MINKKIYKENSSSNSKKKLTVSTDKNNNFYNNTQEIKNKNNLVFNKNKISEFHNKLLQEIIDSITSFSYNNKSRNKNNI